MKKEEFIKMRCEVPHCWNKKAKRGGDKRYRPYCRHCLYARAFFRKEISLIELCYVCKEKICGATIVEDFNKIRHAECEKQCVHDKPLEVCEYCKLSHGMIPGGISGWINYGKKYHYFDFIDTEKLVELRNRK